MTVLADFLAAFLYWFLLACAASGLVLAIAIIYLGVRDRLEKRHTENIVFRARDELDRTLDRILAGEHAASAHLYPTTRRDVLGVPNEAPAQLGTDRRATQRRDSFDEHD